MMMIMGFPECHVMLLLDNFGLSVLVIFTCQFCSFYLGYQAIVV